MNKFDKVMKAILEVGDRMHVRNQKVDAMSSELMKRGYGIDLTQARKISMILVDQAEVIWKK